MEDQATTIPINPFLARESEQRQDSKSPRDGVRLPMPRGALPISTGCGVSRSLSVLPSCI